MATKRETPVRKKTKHKVTEAAPFDGIAAVVPQAGTAEVDVAATLAPAATAAAKPAATKVSRPKRAVTKPAVAKAANAKPAKDSVAEDPHVRRQLIAMEAYYLAERRGFAAGHEDEDWIAAEAVIRSRHSGASR